MQQTGRISQRKEQSAASTLPEIGKIKIGEKKMSAKGTEYPSALDYFKPTGTFAGEFQKIYGDKPKKLLVVFISNNLAEVCNERFESWTGGKRWGWGDGETFTVYDEGEKRYIENVPKTDPRISKLKWDIILTLRFVLLQMKGVMGYWTFQTKAKATTIPSIVKSFDFVTEKAGSIIGFPFSLIVEKKTGYNPGEPKNYPMVSLVPNFSEENIEAVKDYIQAGGNMNAITAKMVSQLANKPVQPTQPQLTNGGAK